MGDADILELASGSPVESFADGHRLLREGHRSAVLYVLIEGTLEVRRRGRAVIRMSEPGAVVGELGLLLDVPATADVVAVGPTTVHRLDDPEACFAASPRFARHLATTLARRLHQVSTYLADLQDQFADRDDTLGLVPVVLEDLLGADRADPEPGSERERESPY